MVVNGGTIVSGVRFVSGFGLIVEWMKIKQLELKFLGAIVFNKT